MIIDAVPLFGDGGKQVTERRRKLVSVSRLFAQDLLWNTGSIVHAKCTQGLPADAIFISMTYDHLRDMYYFCYESAEWEPIPDGEMLPTFQIEFTNFYVAPFLEQAEKLIEAQYGSDATRWLEEYRAFKKQTGWPGD